MEHSVSRASLERFAAGHASREEKRLIVAHLLKSCTTCAAALRELDCEEPVDAYEKALDRLERTRAMPAKPDGRRAGGLELARR